MFARSLRVVASRPYSGNSSPHEAIAGARDLGMRLLNLLTLGTPQGSDKIGRPYRLSLTRRWCLRIL